MTHENLFNLRASLAAVGLSFVSGLALGHWAPVLGAPQAQGTSAAELAPSKGESPKRFMIPVSDSQPSEGPNPALVTIVQWCDLPDPECARLEPALESLREKYHDVLRVVFRHFAMPDRESSALAHQFARAAHEQGGKFWQARALLLAQEGPIGMPELERFTRELGLDWDAVRSAIESHKYVGVITGDRLFADMFEVKGSNAIFVNGRPLGQSPTPKQLEQLVEQELPLAIRMIANGIPQEQIYAELTKHGEWHPVDPKLMGK